MSNNHRTPFLTIRAEGALLPTDLLQRVVENDRDLGGLTPESYHLSGEKLNEAINRSWNRLLGAWAAFSVAREKLPEGDAGTSVTREKWLLPLFDELDYGRLQITKAIDIEGKSYAISHGWNEVPIHLVGCGAELDRRSAGVTGAAKASPHSLVQELLNRSPERLWGFVSNGLRMRVLRDNASLTRQAYLEFDLEAMMNGEVYADFVVLWLVCHESRLEGLGNRDSGLGSATTNSQLSTANCWLEQWSKVAQERGTRALDGLRVGVERAIEALGKGFIAQPANGSLRSALSSGAVSTLDLYRQLLRLVYRLIFLFVAEDRQLLYDPASDAEARKRYADYYSTARLRRMAERVRGSRHADLYAALKLVMDKLGSGGAPELGLPALGGFLFSSAAMSALVDCELSNAALLEAVRSLAFSQDGRVRRAVDYKNLGSEELGSIYESLLELHPLVNTDAATFELTAVSGSERKTTGSYYTPSSLIQVLIDSALEPVIGEALKRAASDDRPQTVDRSPSSVVQRQEQAILNLKVVDPACGSGHFLVAAAHRLARRLATVRTGEGEPAPEATRSALRSVISNCIYGVDINPMSVELCKVSLWMEALEPGKPLSFLDAHIQCGDSLVGVSPNLDISEIPDEAFNPAFGDDKATSSALKKRNKRERGGSHADKAGQLGFRFEVTHMTSMDDLARWLAERAEQVDAMPEDDSTQVQAKAKAFDDYHASIEYLKNRFELDLWTAAFFWKISKADGESVLAPTQQELIQLRNGGELDSRLVERVKELSERVNFFHWELAFPKVFSGENPGFDCVLGNPPWERIKLQEEEFFAQRDPEIVAAQNKAARKKLIVALIESNPSLASAYSDAKHAAECSSKFFRQSKRYPLTATGDVNTYALFSEFVSLSLSKNGRAGIIVPTGLATDDTLKEFFSSLFSNKKLVSLFGFINQKKIFEGIKDYIRFALITLGNSERAEFAFMLTEVSQINDQRRRFYLTKEDLNLLNPNTRTSPIFRTNVDAEFTKKIYNQVPVFQNDRNGDDPWQITFMRMLDMSNDSSLFVNSPREGVIPVYEGKLIWHFDHRFSTYENASQANVNEGNLPQTNEEQKSNPNFRVLPRYWIDENEVIQRLAGRWNKKWLLGFRAIASSTNERTGIYSIIPWAGCAAGPLCNILSSVKPDLLLLLLGNLNSYVFDYVLKQKLGGATVNFFILKQLPVLPPSAYTPADIDFIAPRVLELVYTANDLRPFAEDMGYHGEPFRWDEVRRAQVRAELDAYYARLYGLTRDELRYILDPKEVHGEDFPGETFRVLKEKEVRLYGEYRTSRLVLEAWDGQGKG
jgi:type I restriction-modification system DNA methylase subunit